MSKNNVVFLIDTMNRSGGTERFIQSTCELLSEHYNLHVITIDGGKPSVFPLPDGVNLISLPKIKLNRMAMKWPLGTILARMIKSKLRQIKGEIHLVPVCLRPLQLSLKYLSDYNVIACLHRNYQSVKNGKEVPSILQNAGRANCWMGLTQYDIQIYSSWHHQVHYVPNYSNYAINVQNKKLLSQQEPIQFVSAGHVIKRKAYHRSIEALKHLADENMDFRYHIYGNIELDANYYNRLLELITELKLGDKVVFHGKVDHLKQIYKDKDIFLMSSVGEAFGLVLTEAKAHGLPCISLDAPSSTGPREIIRHAIDGFICQNHQDFLQAIKKLQQISNYGVFSSESLQDHKQRFSPKASLTHWQRMLADSGLMSSKY